MLPCRQEKFFLHTTCFFLVCHTWMDIPHAIEAMPKEWAVQYVGCHHHLSTPTTPTTPDTPTTTATHPNLLTRLPNHLLVPLHPRYAFMWLTLFILLLLAVIKAAYMKDVQNNEPWFGTMR